MTLSTQAVRYSQRPLEFNGGLNLVAPPTELADNELVTCTNFYIDESGVLKKRPGMLKDLAGGPVAGATGVIGVDWIAGAYLIPVNGPGGIQYQSGSATPLTGWPGVQGLWWGLYINGVNYLGLTDGAAGGIRILTGAAIGAVIVNSPLSTTAVWHKNRIFTNVTSALGRVAFSNPNAPGTWSIADTLDIGVDDRESISCFASVGDLLYIFKQNSIWTLYVQGNTPADWVVRKISNNLGSIATGQYAVLVDKNLMYIIDKTGIYLSNGVSFSSISENIWDATIRSQIGSASRIMKLGNYLVVNISLNTALNRTFVYNLERKAWAEWTFFNSAVQLDSIFCISNTSLISNGGVLLAMATVGGVKGLYWLDMSFVDLYSMYVGLGFPYGLTDGFTQVPNATGTPVTSTFKSKEFTSFLDFYWRIKWASLEYIASTPGPSFNMIGDGSARSVVTPGFHATLRKGYKIPGAGRCRVVQLNCSHTLITPFEFYRGQIHFGIKTHISASGTP